MANLNYNHIAIAGRLTADVELKTTQTGVSVCSFTVAVNRRKKKDEEQKADFFNVTAWHETAEIVSKYFQKGSSIFVVGELQTRSWEKEGQKHYATDIVARDIRFVDSKSEAGQAVSAPESYAPATNAYTEPDGLNFEELSAGDDLPF
jgi:single-strand DNA-binding protein